MRTGERAKVIKLNRPTKQDRSEYVGKEGLVMRRLNVAWEPEHGELWELRMDDSSSVVFSASELAVVTRDGREVSLDDELADMRENWGKADRGPSLPFRRFGAGTGAAPAVLALLVFAIAGSLLVWAGVADENWLLGIAGAVLVLFGIGAAGVLIS
jgi:hypothetical protein